MNNLLKLFFNTTILLVLCVGFAVSENHKILFPDKKIGRISKVWSNEIIIRVKSTSNNPDNINRILNTYSSSIVSVYLAPDESIFRQSQTFLENRNLNLEKINAIIVSEEPLLRTYHLQYSGDESPEAFCMRLLMTEKSIEIAEPVGVDEILTQSIPNDPLVGQQSLLSLISAFDAWGIYRGDTNIVIGVSDGGIYQQHPDLLQNISHNWNEIPDDGIDNDNNGYIDDFLGYNIAYQDDGTKPGETNHSSDHGTGVASIAAASTNNSKGIAGVGYKSRIFPIKTAVMNDNGIKYGYQSILYSAKRGLKVLNCSWGQPKAFSQIDQSVVNYAVANDVAIVAAGGNGNNSLTPYFPAGYFGVLAVGETDLTDRVTGSSTMGAEIDIMAPGENSYVAKNNGSYAVETSGGTSFASPVVAGVLALVRGRYPNLTALQAQEFTRQAVDDITAQNDQWTTMVRGRVNALKAVTIDPFSIPGIKPLKLNFFNKSLMKIDRLTNNEEAYLEIEAFNYLGNAKNLKFTLSMAYDFGQSIQIMDSTIGIEMINSNSQFSIARFKLKLLQEETSKVIFRVDISCENGYHDFFMVPLIPTSEVTTFSNGILTFSVGDRGHIGFVGTGENQQGVGILYNDVGSLIYKGGLIATANNNQVVSSNFSQMFDYCDFKSEKSFTEPDKFTGLLNDEAASQFERIGLSVQQTYLLASKNNIAKSTVKIKNTSGKILSDVSLGYYFDWDIPPNSDKNTVGIFPESIPESFKAVAAAAEIAQYSGSETAPVCGCVAYSNDENLRAQAAGMDYATTKSFSKANQIASLSSGSNIQYNKVGDINMIVGMRFPGNMLPNTELSFNFFFGCANSKSELATAFQSALLGLGVDNSMDDNSTNFEVYPNPTNDYISLKFSNIDPNGLKFVILDVLGNEVVKSTSGYNGIINISILEAGFYIVHLNSNGRSVFSKFIKY